jgi:cobyrinic acid a,c-diamide synthase
MAGLLPLETSFAERRLQLGYRALRTLSATPLGPAGAAFRGHEFHFATILAEGAGDPLFRAADADGTALAPAGRVRGRVMGSFVHLVDAECHPHPVPPPSRGRGNNVSANIPPSRLAKEGRGGG